MAIVRWVPRRSMMDWADELDKMWGEDMPSRWYDRESMWQPRVDINDSKDAVHVTAEIPGLTEKDISIKIKDNHLMISGEKKVDEF